MSNPTYLRITGKVGNLVYQRVAPGLGNVPGDPTRTQQVHAYVPNNTSNTPAQAAARARFTAAMTAWQALTPQERDEYKKRASRDGLHGVNLFVSIYMRS